MTPPYACSQQRSDHRRREEGMGPGREAEVHGRDM